MELPALPRAHEVIDGLWEEVFGPYDADEMRAYGIACAQAALDAAAKVCDGVNQKRHKETWRREDDESDALEEAAAAIRAIQVQP